MGDLPAESLSTPAAADDDYALLANQIVDIFYKMALANSREVQKDLLFLPTNLADGVELSDDRMPVIRSAVYGVAFARRSR